MLSLRILHTLLAPLLGVALFTASLPCSAQLRLDVVPEAALAPNARRASTTANALSLPPTASRTSVRALDSSTSSWFDSAIQLEEPRLTNDGSYTRPKFHVGVPSESMRGLMNSAGFDADKCQLPMVRARTKSSGDGDLNGTLWLFARCTFR